MYSQLNFLQQVHSGIFAFSELTKAASTAKKTNMQNVILVVAWRWSQVRAGLCWSFVSGDWERSRCLLGDV